MHLFSIPTNPEGQASGELHLAGFRLDGGFLDSEKKLFSINVLHPKPVLPGSTTLIRFKNIVGILSDGTELQLGGKDLTLGFTGFKIEKQRQKYPFLNIYPNPSDGVFYFHLDDEEAGDWRIMDATGRLLDIRPEMQQRDFMLDLSEYAAGVYFLQLRRSEGQLETWKLLVKGSSIR